MRINLAPMGTAHKYLNQAADGCSGYFRSKVNAAVALQFSILNIGLCPLKGVGKFIYHATDLKMSDAVKELANNILDGIKSVVLTAILVVFLAVSIFMPVNIFRCLRQDDPELTPQEKVIAALKKTNARLETEKQAKEKDHIEAVKANDLLKSQAKASDQNAITAEERVRTSEQTFIAKEAELKKMAAELTQTHESQCRDLTARLRRNEEGQAQQAAEIAQLRTQLQAKQATLDDAVIKKAALESALVKSRAQPPREVTVFGEEERAKAAANHTAEKNALDAAIRALNVQMAAQAKELQEKNEIIQNQQSVGAKLTEELAVTKSTLQAELAKLTHSFTAEKRASEHTIQALQEQITASEKTVREKSKTIQKLQADNAIFSKKLVEARALTATAEKALASLETTNRETILRHSEVLTGYSAEIERLNTEVSGQKTLIESLQILIRSQDLDHAAILQAKEEALGIALRETATSKSAFTALQAKYEELAKEYTGYKERQERLKAKNFSELRKSLNGTGAIERRMVAAIRLRGGLSTLSPGERAVLTGPVA